MKTLLTELQATTMSPNPQPAGIKAGAVRSACVCQPYASQTGFQRAAGLAGGWLLPTGNQPKVQRLTAQPDHTSPPLDRHSGNDTSSI